MDAVSKVKEIKTKPPPLPTFNQSQRNTTTLLLSYPSAVEHLNTFKDTD